MTKQRRFTKEFEDEAVRLVATSGRTQREVAEDLGVGLSTLVRWIGRRRDRVTEMPDQAPQRPADPKVLLDDNGGEVAATRSLLNEGAAVPDRSARELIHGGRRRS